MTRTNLREPPAVLIGHPLHHLCRGVPDAAVEGGEAGVGVAGGRDKQQGKEQEGPHLGRF